MPVGNEAAKVISGVGYRRAFNQTNNLITATAITTNYQLDAVHTANRTSKIRKLVLTNRGVTNLFVLIGKTSTGLVGGAFTQTIAGYYLVAQSERTIAEDEIPGYDFESAGNIFAQISVASAGVDISGEVEEFGR